MKTRLPQLFENKLIFNENLEPFDILFRNFFDSNSFFEPIYNHLKYPVDIHENENSLNIEIALPGVDKKDINIEEYDDYLHIYYNKQESDEKDERHYIQKGISNRSFDFGWKISDKFNLKQIEASMDKGLLKIEIPKAEIKTTQKNIIKIK